MPKNSGKKSSSKGEDKNNNQEGLKDMFEKLHARQQYQESRQQKWNEAWERKLQKEEQCEDLKACCAPDVYFPKPRAQSNIWLQVSHEKNTQRVQLAFMNSKVPKPSPPELPPMTISQIKKMEVEFEKSKAEESKKKATDGKKNKKKKK